MGCFSRVVEGSASACPSFPHSAVRSEMQAKPVASPTKFRKLVVMGFPGVGKTTIGVQFVEKQFVDHYSPTISNTFHTKMEHKGSSYDLEIVDSAGQDEHSMWHAQRHWGRWLYSRLFGGQQKVLWGDARHQRQDSRCVRHGARGAGAGGEQGRHGREARGEQGRGHGAGPGAGLRLCRMLGQAKRKH